MGPMKVFKNPVLLCAGGTLPLPLWLVLGWGVTKALFEGEVLTGGQNYVHFLLSGFIGKSMGFQL